MAANPDAETSGPARDDAELMRAVARRDRVAFEALYHRYAPRLGRYAIRLLRQRDAVDEVIDDVMLAVWEGAARFDPVRSRLSTWLFGITHHKAMTRLGRASSAGEALALDAAGVEPDASDTAALDPEQAAMGRQLGTALADAMARLSPDHRAVIELAFGEDCSYQEIAQVTGAPVNTVKTRMFHARKRLARLLRWPGASDGSSAP